jgi:prepilin-type N-terminal cleavage/methylation domain-containing protein
VKQSAFTLVEVIVAMTLLALGGLGVAATALLSMQTLARAELTERAMAEAQLVLDSLSALPVNVSGRRDSPGVLLMWPAADSAAEMIVRVTVAGQAYHLVGRR